MNPTLRAIASFGSIRHSTHATPGEPPFTRSFFPSLRPLRPLWTLSLLLAFTAFSAFSVSASRLPEIPAAIDAPTISACDPITADTIWSSGVYTGHNCNIHIPAGVTLTLQAGAVVKLGGVSPNYGSGPGSAALIVDGGLVVVGDGSNPVAFTTLADDSQGGDSDDNGASSGTAGGWYGIVFRPGSRGRLDHFSVRYAGSGTFNAVLGEYGSAQIEVNSADVVMADGTVAHGLQQGIGLKGTGIAPVLARLIVNDNRMANGRGYAIYQDTINQNPVYSDLTLAGNDLDKVMVRVSDAISQDVHWGGADYAFVCGYSLCQMIVPNGKTLTVAPGTLLDFGPSYGITIAEGGTLIALGTASQPITFTSQQAAAGTPDRYWIGLWAQQGSQLRLDYCDVSYASDGNFGMGGLEIDTNDALLNHCHIHHNAGDGVYLHSLASSAIHPEFTDVDVTDNGRTGLNLQASHASSLSLTWEGGSISRNGWSGVASYTSNSSIYPTLRKLNISGNGALGDFPDRKRGISFDNHNVNPVLENVTLTNNTGEAMGWYCNGSITAKEVTATGNGRDDLLIPGCSVGSGRLWELGDVGIPVRITGGIEVVPNGLLSLSPGTNLRFDKNVYGSPTALSVRDQAALYALGTAEMPIVFTGATAETGWWAGIEAVDRATIALHHCQIAYAGATSGNNLSASLEIRWGLSGGVPTSDIQNCEIAYSGRKGVLFDFANFQNTTPPVFRYNSIHNTGQEAVANWNAPVLDARNNWWGDASGPYHPTLNPSGLGDNAGDNITFYPWLGAPDTGGAVSSGAMLVSTGAPRLISPGQTVDYAVQYFNTLTETVQNAVLLLQLPKAGAYVESTGGGIYWPQRHQVFWVLGDIAPGMQDFLSVRIRFDWGLARDYKDGTITLLSGSNYNSDALDVAGYTDYAQAKQTVSITVKNTQAAFDVLRAANPDLESLYQEALGQGYVYVDATRSTFEDGSTINAALLSTANRQFSRMLTLYDGQALAVTTGGGQFILHDMGGGMTFTPTTMQSEYWGNWSPPEVGSAAVNACTSAKCKVHCVGKSVTLTVVVAAGRSVLSWATFGLIPPPDAFDEVKEITKTVVECKKNCETDPLNGCCDADGQVRWSPGIFSGWCTKEYCNATTGTYGTPGQLFCPNGTRCVSGTDGKGGCLSCKEAASLYTVIEVGLEDPGVNSCAWTVGDGGDCSDTGIFVAKDPNAIYGPSGDMLPGSTALYTITYENVGAGRAYGVYVISELPAVFDAASLELNGAGTYRPENREIFWMVGELGPKGAVDSEGAITYTVALTGGLPSGTVVSNQAVVYFASVPEETPTNTWVNLVSPLVAIPQQLTTAYITPLSLTLAGQEVSQLPLTFEIVEPPHGGILSGTPPNLTYTPAENFTGPDSFSFRVSNGTSTSRAAQVRIDVATAGDTTGPQVVWTSPAADAKNVSASASPIFTDTAGPVYAPVIVIGVSEALSDTTVTTATVTLADGAGSPVTGTVRFDGAVNQIVFGPLAALEPGKYTVTVGTGVTDMAGNALAAAHVWQFEIKGPGAEIYLPMLRR